MIRQELDIFLTALMFFTRIPVPTWANYTYKPEYLQESSRYFPLTGWIVGGVAAVAFVGADMVLPTTVAVLLSMVVSVFLTGAFHEDGFADMCDGFGGGVTKEKVLIIMKDSRLGTYGTIGLGMMLALKAVSSWEIAAYDYSLFPLVLLVAHSVSRLCAGSVLYTHEYVREDATSKAKPLSTQMSQRSLAVAALFGLLPLGLLYPFFWLLLLPVGVVRWGLARYFVRRIGGYTGDCLGAMQQVCEVMVYLSFLVLLFW